MGDAIKPSWKPAVMNLFLVTLLGVAFAKPNPDQGRSKKSIGLFTVVQFPNDECQVKSSKDYRGVCLSSSECNTKGGSIDGGCGAGFGVCCKFIISSNSNANVVNNVTYVQNDGYPSSITTASKSIDYAIKPLTNNICMIRFDFQALTIGITAVTGVCKDKFTVTGTAGVSPPVICGDNAGYHMYVDNGKKTSDVKAVMSTDTATTSRSWNIKISQIECDNPNKPPSDCIQYFDCGAGTIQSWNFNGGLMVAMLAQYSICFRPNTGACGVAFRVDDGTTTPNPFCLPSAAATPSQVSAPTTAPCTTESGSRQETCSVAGISFPGYTPNDDTKAAVTSGTFLCGTKLNPLDKKTANSVIFNRGFIIQVIGTSSTDVKGANGFKLNFQQTCQ